MRVLAIIPARYASTRFPGKPLATLGGESIISRVYNRVRSCRAIDDVIVATDDEDICDHVESFAEEGSVMLTFEDHHSGTDRCGEVLQRLENVGNEYDVVLNVQGDEPFIDPAQLKTLVSAFDNPDVQIATLATPIKDNDELLSPDNVKVVCGIGGRALYFSRQPLPHRRGIDMSHWTEEGEYYKHIGVYAFRPKVLNEICQLEPDPLEEAEKLEQLRWLAAGYNIQVIPTDHESIGIDTPDDLAAAEEYMIKNKIK